MPIFDHLSIGVRNIETARRFYDAALAPLGMRRLYEGADYAAYGRNGQDDFSIYQGGEGWCPDPKVHIAFRAESQDMVEQFYRKGIAAGGSDDGPPAIRD